MVAVGWVDVSAVMRPGVYALVRRGKVIYVGQSRAVYQRIYGHRQVAKLSRGVAPSWAPIKGFEFDEVWVKTCRVEELDTVQAAAIAAWKPYWNAHEEWRAQAEGVA